jgi:hypothetical protein
MRTRPLNSSTAKCSLSPKYISTPWCCAVLNTAHQKEDTYKNWFTLGRTDSFTVNRLSGVAVHTKSCRSDTYMSTKLLCECRESGDLRVVGGWLHCYAPTKSERRYTSLYANIMSVPTKIVAERPVNVSSPLVLSDRRNVNGVIEIHRPICIRHVYRPGKTVVYRVNQLLVSSSYPYPTKWGRYNMFSSCDKDSLGNNKREFYN